MSIASKLDEHEHGTWIATIILPVRWVTLIHLMQVVSMCRKLTEYANMVPRMVRKASKSWSVLLILCSDTAIITQPCQSLGVILSLAVRVLSTPVDAIRIKTRLPCYDYNFALGDSSV